MTPRAAGIGRWAGRGVLAAVLASSSCDGSPCNYCSDDRTVLTTTVSSEQRASILEDGLHDGPACRAICESALGAQRRPDASSATLDAGPTPSTGLFWNCELRGLSLTCTGIVPCNR